MDYSKIERRLVMAKSRLILNYPFVGSLSLQIPHNINPNMQSPYPGMEPTAQTDGKTVEYHPTFVNKLSQEELLFVCAHEIFHPLFEHTSRRRHRDPMLWNIAADYVINYHLRKEGIGKMPAECLYDEDLFNKGDGVTERIYDLLLSEQEDKGKGNGKGKGRGNPLDNCTEGGANEAERSEMEQQWRMAAAAAAQTAKMAGKLSENMARLFDEIMAPKVAWQDVLAEFVVKSKTDERTYARPARRFAAQGLYMPSISGEAMGEFAFCIDCSGSVSAKDLAQFNAEVSKVWTDCRPSAMHILYFDSKVCHYDKYDENNPFDKLTPHGGGGTAFSPCFRYMEDNDIEPVACVFLTDLYCSDYGPPPAFPVLWVTYGATNAPWGQVVKM